MPKPQVPDTPAMAALRDQSNRYRRQVRALTAGNKWLENAAEVCAGMTMNGPKILDAIHRVRKRCLHERYHHLPLCDIERTMHRSGIAAMVILLVYEIVAPAIERQLDGLVEEMRDDPEAAARAATDPPLSLERPRLWPGNYAGGC